MKRLPFIIDPIIKSYQWHAFALGILFTNTSYQNGFFNKYIQIVRDHDLYGSNCMIDYYIDKWYYYPKGPFRPNVCYFEDIEKEDIQYVKKYFDMHRMIEDMIDQGKYIYGYYNEYYIKGKSSYLKRYFEHDYILYGYNRKDKKYLSIGYNDNQIYQEFEIDYDDFENAFYSMKTRNQIKFLTNDVDFQYTLDIERLKDSLSMYINSQNPGGFDDKVARYGLNVWETIDEVIEVTRATGALDLRKFKVFQEHKEIMQKRIFYLIKCGYLNSDEWMNTYQSLIESGKIVFNLALKYTISPSKSLLDKISFQIHSTIKPEREFLSKLITEL
ncbi:MAG: hypothetical protein PHH84_06000 [Oscillospiraceae bacterium]|nr:hypothetical protein [Oscillospiraceae bacterium]